MNRRMSMVTRHPPELEVINPATGEVVDTVRAYAAEEIDPIIRRAHAAQPEWEATPRHARASILTDFANRMEADTEKLLTILQRESGKLRAAAEGEIRSATRVVRGYIAALGNVYGESTRLEGDRKSTRLNSS